MSKLSVLAVAVLAGTSVAQAASVGVDEGATWLGYMNVFALPSDGGGFQFGSPWGTPDLNANFNAGTHQLTLSPNTIGDPNPYWYIGGGGPGGTGGWWIATEVSVVYAGDQGFRHDVAGWRKDRTPLRPHPSPSIPTSVV